MRRCPKSVKVGPHTYGVRWIPNLKNDAGEEVNGLMDDENFDISLHSGQKRRCRKQDTLLHEVLHACISGAIALEGAQEESIVQALTPRLLQVIQDNPDLVSYLAVR